MQGPLCFPFFFNFFRFWKGSKPNISTKWRLLCAQNKKQTIPLIYCETAKKAWYRPFNRFKVHIVFFLSWNWFSFVACAKTTRHSSWVALFWTHPKIAIRFTQARRRFWWKTWEEGLIPDVEVFWRASLKSLTATCSLSLNSKPDFFKSAIFVKKTIIRLSRNSPAETTVSTAPKNLPLSLSGSPKEAPERLNRDLM